MTFLYLEFVLKNLGLPLYVTYLFSFAAFKYSFFVLHVEYFDYMSGCMSFLILMVWCSLSFLHLDEPLFLNIVEVFSYYFY
jgi:hypothetical protein